MPQGSGNVFQLDPNLFGFYGLGSALQQFGEQRRERKQEDRAEAREDRADARQEDLDEFAKHQQLFQNMLGLGDREAAARYFNTVINPGAGATARKTTDEFLDEMLLEGLETGSRGEPLSPFVEDLINTRVFGTLTPEQDKAIRSGELTTQEVYRRGLELANEGQEVTNIGTALENDMRRIEIARAEREDAQRARMDAAAQAAGFDSVLALQQFEVPFAQLQDLEATTERIRELAPLERRQTLADISRTRAETRRIDMEIAKLMRPESNFADLMPVLQPHAQALLRAVESPVAAENVVKFLLDPSDPTIGQDLGPITEAHTRLNEIAQAEGRKVFEQASEENRKMLQLIASIAPLREDPNVLMPFLAGAINEAYGDGTASIEEVSRWFGLSSAEEFSMDRDRIISVAEGVLVAAEDSIASGEGVDATIDVGGLTQQILDERGIDAATLRQEINEQFGDASPEDQAIMQQMLDHLGPSEEEEGDQPTSDATAAIDDSTRAFEERISRLPANHQARARSLVQRAREQREIRDQARAFIRQSVTITKDTPRTPENARLFSGSVLNRERRRGELASARLKAAHDQLASLFRLYKVDGN